METDLKTLVKQRGIYKGQITRIINSTSALDTSNLQSLQFVQNKLKGYYDKWADTQNQIELIDETGEQEREALEVERVYEKYFVRLAQYIDDIIAAKTSSAPASNTSSAEIASDKPCLNSCPSSRSIFQQIRLPEFDGNPDEWHNFRDSFLSLVHNNPSIPDVQKFHLLKNALRGKIVSAIRTINITSENYAGAWEQLQRKCEVPRKIIQGHLKQLLDLPDIYRDTPENLSHLLEESELRVRALEKLQPPATLWESILVFIITRKLDKNTRRLWEQTLENSAIPKFNELITFLERQSRGDCEDEHNRTRPLRPSSNEKPRFVKPKSQAFVATQHKPFCQVCKGEHYVRACPAVLKASPRERLALIKRANLCINCLRPGHAVVNCSSGDCRRCHKKHNTILHFDDLPPPTDDDIGKTGKPIAMTVVADPEVLLSTAVITIFGKDQQPFDCRVLLDNGSQSHFITKEFSERLGLPISQHSVAMSGIEQCMTHSIGTIETDIHSKTSKLSLRLKFHILNNITSYLPSRPINRRNLQLPRGLPLADPEFHRPGPIDALLGSSVFFGLLSIGQIRVAASRILLQKTRLGWLVIEDHTVSQNNTQPKSCFVSRLEEQLQKFWELEDATAHSENTRNHPAEISFAHNHTRDDDGRYEVALPFNSNISKLGESFETASRRFAALERKFGKNQFLAEQYQQFMAEYRDLGHMTESTDSDNQSGYFLPHHAVFKTSEGETKIRVVFDASAKTDSGLSLNDCLVVGPTVQQDLFSIVTRFRTYHYALIADVEKMYRQINVVPEHRAFQKILWRDSVSKPLKTFTLNTVTYGTASAPFLATRCLRQLALDEEHRFPNASQVISRDMYVDDLLSGASTRTEALHLRDELIQITTAGGLHLRKWASNCADLLEGFAEENKPRDLCVDADQGRKTLGIQWHPKSDVFKYAINGHPKYHNCTKRTILSQIAQVFDPLGLVGPFVVEGKCILQTLWASGITWDESPPQAIYSQWKHWLTQVSHLNQLSIPRKVLVFEPEHIEIHGFCDASIRAYGACLYIKSYSRQDRLVQLLCSKSRVAPLKTVSVPRLELCAAHLLAKLFLKTSVILNIPVSNYHLWSDSTVVIHWLQKSPHTLKTFVSNRVSKIQSLTNIAQWRHVPTTENPADILSRGQDARFLINNELWWHGPSWLHHDREHWPSAIPSLAEGTLPEERVITALTTIVETNFIWSRFSRWNTLVRVIAYCLRWSKSKNRVRGSLTVDELRTAHNKVIQCIQQEQFATDYTSLRKLGKLESSSRLLSLNPFVDENNLLRVGGRLRNSDLFTTQKHPLLLPKNHPVTDMLIVHIHQTHWHTGVNNTLNAVRQRYWPVGGRAHIKRVLHRCVTCFKHRPVAYQYQMAPLPANRVTSCRAFLRTGIDYCGPFFVKERTYRNRGKVKVYVAVFVCFVTKAVHLELVSDMTTEACLAAIKRFVGRRGVPSSLHSDNGSNFLGARNELADILNSNEAQQRISSEMASQHIQWHLSPPRAPHFGGLWEAAVKGFKTHLYRVVKNTLMTYDAFNTCLIGIEAVLNSRPLTPISSDPTDFSVLTPAHFLIGERLTNLPERDFSNLPENRLTAWQQTQKIQQQFWARWHREYLHELHTRSKWHQDDRRSITVDQLVLIKEDNMPPLYWKMGRISKTFPGVDGIIRVAEVRTMNGVLTRPVKKLCPLPIDS